MVNVDVEGLMFPIMSFSWQLLTQAPSRQLSHSKADMRDIVLGCWISCDSLMFAKFKVIL